MQISRTLSALDATVYEAPGVSSNRIILELVQVDFVTQQRPNLVETNLDDGLQAEIKSMGSKICWQAHQQQHFGEFSSSLSPAKK